MKIDGHLCNNYHNQANNLQIPETILQFTIILYALVHYQVPEELEEGTYSHWQQIHSR